MKERNVGLLLARNHRLAVETALLVHVVLVLEPFLVVAYLIAFLSPLLGMLPPRYEHHTPYHYEKGIQEVSWTVVSCELEQHVEEHSEHSHYGGQDQPSLHELEKIKIGLSVSSHVRTYALCDDGTVVATFLYGI